MKKLTARLHISRFLAMVSAGIIIGAAVCPLLPESVRIGFEGLALALVFFVITAIRRTAFLLILALVVGLIIGFWRGGLERQALEQYRPYFGKNVITAGRVSEDVSYGAESDQRVRLDKVQVEGQSLSGKIWISLDASADIKRGDRVVLNGKLTEGFGNMAATIYRARVDSIERPNPGDVGRRLRDWFAGGIRRAIPEPEASLASGYLLGQRSSLPEDFEGQLKAVGLTHVVVASGYNLTILVAISRRIFARFSKYLATLTSGAMIGGFMLITGFTPSMSRAGLVSGLSLAAWYFGRVIHPLVLLPFAAAITVLLNPTYVWGDIGWCLSFTAFTGVILLAPLLHDFFWGRKKPGLIRETVVGTMAAQAVTLPIILVVFGQYSAYALPANVLVLPLVPLAMLLTFIGGLTGLIAPASSSIIAAPASVVLHYMTSVVGWIASLPGAQSEVKFGPAVLVAGYMLLVILIVILQRKTRHNFKADQTA